MNSYKDKMFFPLIYKLRASKGTRPTGTTHERVKDKLPLKLYKGVWYYSLAEVWNVALIQTSKWEQLGNGQIIEINEIKLAQHSRA
tara:strand:- start:217 stop:474 length:258 start_codon:yes stop_codon:yes gene_type:complete